jgi:predicted Zn-dependent protease
MTGVLKIALQLQKISQLLHEGALPEAEEACVALLAAYPMQSGATHFLGLVRTRRGDVAAGEQLLRRSVELDPGNSQFRTNFAHFLRRGGRVPEAEAQYRAVLSVDPALRAARYGLALMLDERGSYGEAESECRRLLDADERDPATWALLGDVLANQNRLPEAEAALQRALELDPADALLPQRLAAVLVRLDRPEQALGVLQQAAERGAAGFELLLGRGMALTLRYRLEEAEGLLVQAVRLRPRHLEAQRQLARLRYLRADAMFERDLITAVDENPDELPLQALLGTLRLRTGQHAQARAQMQKLLARRPALPQCRALLAQALRDAGELEAAEREALEAASDAARDPEIIATLVSILLARSGAIEAMEFIRAQRRLEPHSQTWLAYAAAAARALGSEEHRSLFDYTRFVRRYRISAPAQLLGWLEPRFGRRRQSLEYELHEGSHTLRNLLTETEPPIAQLLQAFEEPLQSYLQDLGTESGHPFSVRNTGRASIERAWGLQLHQGGFQRSHLHPRGWISAIYFVELPDQCADERLRAGWLHLGLPPYAPPGASAELYLRPEAGMLVLFPSYLWHGTTPVFGPKALSTVAFEAVPA